MENNKAKFVKLDRSGDKFCVMICFENDMDCLVFGSAKKARQNAESLARIHRCEFRCNI
jgi:hypothetical protein